MQPYPKSANRSNLVNPPPSKFYDPSEPYRALLAPPNNPKPENPTMSQAIPPTNIDLKTGVPKQIPKFYYSEYDEYDDHLTARPNFVRPQPPPPPVIQQTVPTVVQPYSQPIPLATDPYSSGRYYPYGTPYGTPYMIPMTSPVHEPAPILPEPTKTDIIAAHQQDADLSRLEVYHFTAKQDRPSKGTNLAQAAQPIIQYHVYPYPPGAGAAPPPPPPPQQYPPYSQPWSNHPPNIPPYQPNAPIYPPNGSPYVSEPPPPLLSLADTKARGSQTEQPSTKNRAVSPMYIAASVPNDEDGYPYVHQKRTHTDRHNIPTGRIDRKFYDISRTTPLSDCRCLDCQRERSKVLNYYPD